MSMRSFITFLFTNYILALAIPVQAQDWSPLGQTMHGEAAGDLFGIGMETNADGTIVAIGSPFSDHGGANSGHVEVYQFTAGTWTQMGTDIDGEASADNSAADLAMNAAGDIIAIGAFGNDSWGPSAGEVRVFQFNGTDWIQLGDDIAGDPNGGDFGNSLSLNASGDRLVVGDNSNDNNGNAAGYVKVYQYDGVTWNQLGSTIMGAENTNFGYSTDINAIGDIIACGGTKFSGNYIEQGQVIVYQYDGSDWTQLGLMIEGLADQEEMGHSVALSAAGNRLIVGGIGEFNQPTFNGRARVYDLVAGQWLQVGPDIIGASAMERLGYDTDISSNGEIIAIGAYGTVLDLDEPGSIRSMAFDGVDWNIIGSIILGESDLDAMGASVCLSDDGQIMIGAEINGDENGTNSGSVRAFILSCIPSEPLSVTTAQTVQHPCDSPLPDNDYEVTGGCAPYTVSISDEYFSGGCMGVLVRTINVSDSNGETSSATIDYMLYDDLVPVITCPSDTMIADINMSAPSEIGMAMAMDNCSMNPEITYSDGPISGNPPSFERTWLATDSCMNQSSCIQLVTQSLVDGLGENFSELFFDLSPNPTTGIVHIRLSEETRSVDIAIMNLQSGLVFHENQIPISSSIELELGGLSSGTYLLFLRSDATIGVKKVVVTN